MVDGGTNFGSITYIVHKVSSPLFHHHRHRLSNGTVGYVNVQPTKMRIKRDDPERIGRSTRESIFVFGHVPRILDMEDYDAHL